MYAAGAYQSAAMLSATYGYFSRRSIGYVNIDIGNSAHGVNGAARAARTRMVRMAMRDV